jgi:IS605 OrfB family transposase
MTSVIFQESINQKVDNILTPCDTEIILKSKRTRNNNRKSIDEPFKKQSIISFFNSSISIKKGFWSLSRQEISKIIWTPVCEKEIISSKNISLNVKSENSHKHSTWFNVIKIESTKIDILLSKPYENINITSSFISSTWPKTENNDLLPYIEINEQETVIIPKSSLGLKIKGIKIKLQVQNQKDHITLRKVFGAVRWTYNRCIEKIRKYKEQKWTQKTLSELIVNSDSPALKKYPWLNDVGHDIRRDAVREVMSSLKTMKTQLKNGTIKHAEFHFRSKKSQKSETFYIRKKYIKKQTDNTITIKLDKMEPITFWTGKNAYHGPILMDCRLQKTWTGEYYLCIPYEYNVKEHHYSEKLKICSLDPGVRTFQTIYDVTNNCAYEIAPGDMNYIIRLCICLDKLYSKRDKAPNAKKRYSYKRASRRLSERIKCLVDEVHKQLALFLAKNYDLIMIHKFETSQMIKKENRKISSKTARQMAKWAHYRFRERLLLKCQHYGCKVAIVNESWTSKTCSSCGNLNHQLGAKKIFHCDHCKITMDRDINGAKNIFLKNYEALGLNLTLGPIPFNLETDCCI